MKKDNSSEHHDLLVSQLQNVTALRNHEHQTWLTIFFTSFTTNSLLIVALFSGDHLRSKDAFLIGSLGIALTIFLGKIQKAAFSTMRLYEELSKKIESHLFTNPDLRLFSYNFFRKKFLKLLRENDLTNVFTELKEQDKNISIEEFLAPKNKGSARTSINTQTTFILIWIIVMLYFVVYNT